MFKFTIAILCFIMAAAAIDGPTGQEGDNFLLAFTLLFIGIAIVGATLLHVIVCY